jgi:cell division protein FtsL
MIRYLHVLAIVALLGSAVYAYAIKYETMRYSAEIVKTQHAIKKEQTSIGMLRAEYAHLSRPERIQELADQHLDLVQVTVDQYVKAADLPDRAAKVDAIGRKLEALGLAEPTSTPGDLRGLAARSSTPAAVR